MKIYYDNEVDSAYIQLSHKKPNGVIEIAEFMNIDTTDKGEIVGIELLQASSKISVDTLFNYEVDIESITKRFPDKSPQKLNNRTSTKKVKA